MNKITKNINNWINNHEDGNFGNWQLNLEIWKFEELFRGRILNKWISG